MSAGLNTMETDIDDQVLRGAGLAGDDPEIEQWRPLLEQAWQLGFAAGQAAVIDSEL